MEINHNSSKGYIERSLEATEKAIDVIREGDIIRRHTALELRDIQLSIHEDFNKIRGMMNELEEQIHKERISNSKWFDRKIAKAKATADQALSSTLMVKDVQLLEKKVNILKESVIQVNKAYFKYENENDMKDLMDEITDMVYRMEKMEKDALNMNGNDGGEGGDGPQKMDEEAIEHLFRGAIEGLYGLKSTNPEVMKEAKKLASDLRVFRDSAANKNFYEMISKSTSDGMKSSSFSKSNSYESEFQYSTESSSSMLGSEKKK